MLLYLTTNPNQLPKRLHSDYSMPNQHRMLYPYLSLHMNQHMMLNHHPYMLYRKELQYRYRENSIQ